MISSWFAWASLQAHIIRVFVPRHERTLSVRFTASETPPRRHNSYALPVPPLILPCGPLGKIITVRNTAIYPKTLFSLLSFFFFIWKRNPLLAKLSRCRLNGHDRFAECDYLFRSKRIHFEDFMRYGIFNIALLRME